MSSLYTRPRVFTSGVHVEGEQVMLPLTVRMLDLRSHYLPATITQSLLKCLPSRRWNHICNLVAPFQSHVTYNPHRKTWMYLWWTPSASAPPGVGAVGICDEEGSYLDCEDPAPPLPKLWVNSVKCGGALLVSYQHHATRSLLVSRRVRRKHTQFTGAGRARWSRNRPPDHRSSMPPG